MKHLIFASLVFTLTACSGGGGSGSSEAVDPIYGDWYYQAPGGTSTQAKGIVANVSQDGTIQIANVYMYASGGSAVAYSRKSIGKYVRDGEQFDITYSYETCNPVGNEKIYLRVVGDKLQVNAPTAGLTLVMARSSGNSSLETMAVIEDRKCNILSKIEAEQKRSIASAKPKSFFDRIIK